MPATERLRHAHPKVVPYTVATDMDSPNPDTGEEYPHTNTQLFNILPEQNRFKLGAEISAPYNKVQDDHARPSLLGAAAARSAVAAGKSRFRQRVTSVARDLRREAMPGSPPAGALLIERPGPCGACWI